MKRRENKKEIMRKGAGGKVNNERN
jgi:hypothetical protein